MIALILLLAALPPAAEPPAPVPDAITVTASRTPARLGDTPASVVIVGGAALRVAASPAADDVLRQVPRVSLPAHRQQDRESDDFDDDLNQFPLRRYAVADLFASRDLTPRVALAAALENATNAPVEAGATPVITRGQPRAFRVGVRLR